MKTRIFLSTLVVMLSLSINSFSQVKVTGKVMDNKKAPLEFADIMIQTTNGTLTGTSSDKGGNFELQAGKGNYTLKILMLGYKPYEKEISIQGDIDLGEIQPEVSVIELAEVVVTSQRTAQATEDWAMNSTNDSSVLTVNNADILSLTADVFFKELLNSSATPVASW